MWIYTKKNINVNLFCFISNQYMSEKIGGAEGTKFTDDYTNLERVSFNICSFEIYNNFSLITENGHDQWVGRWVDK